VNFWDNTFLYICCTNSNIFCATTVRFLVKHSALFKQGYCEKRGQKKTVLSSFVSSESVRNFLDVHESVHRDIIMYTTNEMQLYFILLRLGAEFPS
jgi:hypothetical protein